MLREHAFLISSAASHVESNSHCERAASVTMFMFSKHVDKTLRDLVSFHVHIAPNFVIIEKIEHF